MATPDLFPVHTQEFVATVSSNQLPHAWMIRGPRIPSVVDWCFHQAATLLKTDALDVLRSGAHPGLKYIDKAGTSLISVATIRSLGSFVAHTADATTYRVVIIDALNDMTLDAQNALLKKLEEPRGAVVYFVLAYYGTPILPTLRSRCRVMNLIETQPRGEEVSPVDPLFHEVLSGLKQETPDYAPLLKIASMGAKNDQDFDRIVERLLKTVAQQMTDTPLTPKAQRSIERIFHLVNLEKSMHVDRRHMLLAAFFNFESIR